MVRLGKRCSKAMNMNVACFLMTEKGTFCKLDNGQLAVVGGQGQL